MKDFRMKDFMQVIRFYIKNTTKQKEIQKAQIFVCTDVCVSNSKVSYRTGNRLMKFCKVIKSGCIPFIDYRIFK